MVRCPFPYANEPACDRTIAQVGGSTYTAFNAGWLVAAILLFIVQVIQFIRLCRIRGFALRQWKTSFLHQIYAISLFNTFDLVIRSCDPLNWANRMAFPAYRVLQDLGTWSAYALVMLCVCSWVKIMRQISGKSVRPVEIGERLALCITLCFFFSVGIAFSNSTQPYMVVAIDLFLCVAYSWILFTVAWVHGLGVYCHLSRFERTAALRDAKSSNPNSPINSPPPSARSLKKENSAQRKKTKIVIILKLMVVMTVCIFCAMVLQAYNGYLALVDQWDRHTNPEPYPEWRFGSLFQLSGFTIIHGAASTACLFFFRKFGTDSSRELSSYDAKSTSDQSQPTKQSTGKHTITTGGGGTTIPNHPVSPKPMKSKPSRTIAGGDSIEITMAQPIHDTSLIIHEHELISPAGVRASVDTNVSIRASVESDILMSSPSFVTTTITSTGTPVSVRHPAPPPPTYPPPSPARSSTYDFIRTPLTSSISHPPHVRHPFQTSPITSTYGKVNPHELDGITVEMMNKSTEPTSRRTASNHI